MMWRCPGFPVGARIDGALDGCVISLGFATVGGGGRPPPLDELVDVEVLEALVDEPPPPPLPDSTDACGRTHDAASVIDTATKSAPRRILESSF
jgi:hypothetical protein